MQSALPPPRFRANAIAALRVGRNNLYTPVKKVQRSRERTPRVFAFLVRFVSEGRREHALPSREAMDPSQ